MSRPALALSREGDPAVAEVFARALAHEGRVDRWTHGFHTWPAGLHPDAARDVLAAFRGDGAVLDPFCGGGTVLVEARAAGRAAYGFDLSPIARLVASSRTAVTDEAARTAMRSTARRITAVAREATAAPPDRILRAVGGWYHPHVLAELEAIRQGIAAADPVARPLLRAVFSSMLVKVSHRRSDTSARKVVQPRPAGTTAILLHKKARELGRRLEAYAEAVPAPHPPCTVEAGDARRIPSRPDVSLVLTSPPYPGTYDYLPMQTLREVWLGVQGDREAEIGPRRAWRGDPRAARRRWQRDTAAWTASAASVLRPGGHLVVVIGDGHDAQGPIDTRQATLEAAEASGLVLVAGATAGRHDRGRDVAVPEHMLAFRAPLDAPDDPR